DHGQAGPGGRGMDLQRAARHAARIRGLAARRRDIVLLAGIEMDILEGGRLDLEPALLADLDWVIGSVHRAFDQDEAAATARLLAAVGSGLLHALGHPTARRIGRRPPLRFDADRVFRACAEAGVLLEINGSPT